MARALTRRDGITMSGRTPGDDGTLWMAHVAGLFRKQQMDTSVAHIIEAVRLAGALASLRGLAKAGLEELNEATLSVLCNGESILLKTGTG